MNAAFDSIDLKGFNPALLLILVSTAGALLPLLILALSSFIKLNIVFSILRNAIGGQNIPPASLILILSIVLTIQVMGPVWQDTGANLLQLLDQYGAGAEPLEQTGPAAVKKKVGKYRDSAGSLHSASLQPDAAKRKNGRAARPSSTASGAVEPVGRASGAVDPVGRAFGPRSQQQAESLTIERIGAAFAPLTRFLRLNSSRRERVFFAARSRRLEEGRLELGAVNGGAGRVEPAAADSDSAAAGLAMPGSSQLAAENASLFKEGASVEAGAPIAGESFFTIVPAFLITEITEAFKIGFIIYLPFLIVDLVIGNILLSLGMMMINPATVSLPVKLILFVLCEGWLHLVQSLLLGYAH